jgi:hypothetical protein
VFGSDAELSLELYRDPEMSETCLVLYVRLCVYDAGIIERIEHACAPYDDALEASAGQFLVTTDFRRPLPR